MAAAVGRARGGRLDLDAFKTADGANALAQGYLPEFIGIQFSEIAPGQVAAELEVTRHHLAPNDFLHAATVIALADTAAGFGCAANLPDGATAFTTVELKCNFLGTVRDGVIRVVATLAHAGRSTQVWDADVTDANGKTLAMFRCTQMILRQG